MEKKISIVIPCYNVDEYIQRGWKSLLSQTIGIDALECIFVNDASTDDGKTLEALTKIESQAPESVIVVDLPENKGPGGARNIGMEYASGKYLQFFDADDELRPDACQLLYDTAEKYNCDIIQFNHLYVLGDQRKSSENSTENRNYEIKTKDDRINFLNTSLVTYGCTNKFYRLGLIRETGVMYPDHVRYEEPLFVYPLFLYVKDVYLLKEDLYIYHFRQGSTVTSSLGKRLLDHPNVQLMLLENLMGRRDKFEEYKDIIGIYFLWTFFCETLDYSRQYSAPIPLEYFRNMQKICLSFFADWRNNPYVGLIPKEGMEALDSLERNFASQAELDEFIGRLP